MTYCIDIDLANNNHVWNAYSNSYNAFKHPFGHMAGASFWDAYEEEYNVKLHDGSLIFESEAHYTWFMLRWA